MIPFICQQLESLERDLARLQRMLDGIRCGYMSEHGCCDAEAEIRLIDESPLWTRLRREEAAARRTWLSFHRTLEKERKSSPLEEPVPAPTPAASTSDIIETSEPCTAPPSPSPSWPPPPPPPPASPQPSPTP